MMMIPNLWMLIMLINFLIIMLTIMSTNFNYKTNMLMKMNLYKLNW